MRRKFLLSWFLMLLLITGNSSILNAEENVAKVGNTEYATIDEAIANWTNGTTLTLLADVTLSDVIKLSSTEHHILDLSTYTMTAASGKDAIQYVVNGRSSASYALDIKADADNPGGITATGGSVVRHTKPMTNAPSKDRPITRFYGGVFNANYVVRQGGTLGAGYTGDSAPHFYFYGGEYNGTIYTNRSIVQFYGGVFNGSIQMSVDSSAYTLVAGGTFKQLSNLYMSALNSDKFTIGSAKGVFDKEVYIDNDGNYVIAVDEPTQGIEADVAKTPDVNDYLAYSKVATEGQLGYTNVEKALNDNKSATVTVYADEIDMSGINFSGTIVVPEGNNITIENAPAGGVNVQMGDDTEPVTLTPNANGTITTETPEGTTPITNFESLKTALQQEGSYALMNNITVTEQIEIPTRTKITLDLNGYTITASEKIYPINNNGELTINDSKNCGVVEGLGLRTGYDSRNTRAASAKLTINGGTFKNVYPDEGAALYVYQGHVYINAGKFYGQNIAISNTEGGYIYINYEDDVNVNDVEIDGYNRAIITKSEVEISNATVKGVCEILNGGEIYTSDPTNVTFYEVRIGEAANYTSYRTLADAVQAAKNNDVVQIIKEGSYDLPEFREKTLTFEGVTLDKTKTSIKDYVSQGSQGMAGSTVNFKNLTINGANGNYNGLFHTAGVTYNDCNINGLRFLYAPTTFTKCEFNAEGVEHSFWTYGASNVTVTDCTFTYTDRAVNCYSESGANHELDITFSDCDFVYAGTAEEPAGAVEINSSSVKSMDIAFADDCTPPTKGEMWYISGYDADGGDNTIVQVNGETVFEVLPVAKIGDVEYKKLQKAIDAAQNNETITLLRDCGENVTITQKADVKFTIDGAQKTMTGAITVNGQSGQIETAGLTIQNVKFDASNITTEASINLGVSGNTASRYVSNLTVEGCTFTGKDQAKVAVKSYTGGDKNLTVTNCTVDATMHSLLQVNNVEGKLTLTGCTVKSKNGVNLNSCTNVEMTGCNFDVQGYALRSGVNSDGNLGVAKTYVLENNILMSACNDGDAVIMFRASSVDANFSMTKNVVKGTTHISGNTAATNINADANYWGEGLTGTVVAEGSAPVVVNSYYADEDLTVLVRIPMGDNFTAYTREDAIWGEVRCNAVESLVINVLDAGNNVMGTATLKNKDYMDGDVTVTWTMYLDVDSYTGQSWTIGWTTAPNINKMPAKVELWVDGVKVSGGDVVLNAPDNLKKINAANIDAEGKILAYRQNLTEAVNNGDNVAILVAGTYVVPTGKDLTITGAVNDVVFDNIGACNMGGANVTFNNVTFDYYPNVNYTGLQHSGDMVYNNCTFSGQVFLYGTSETFNNCIFNQNSSDAYNVWTYGAAEVAFNGCTFNSAGKSVLVYNEGACATDLTVTDTKFNASATVDDKAAIEIDCSLMPKGTSIIIEGVEEGKTTATGFGTNTKSGSSLWNDKKVIEGAPNGGTSSEVVIDGNVVKEPALMDLAGEGTEENPYLINNTEDLVWFRYQVNAGNNYAGKYVKLTFDVDLNSTRTAASNWEPIGTEANPFKGNFDGGEKTIKNLNVVVEEGKEGKAYIGFFGYADGVTIKNLYFENVNLNIACLDIDHSQGHIGAVAGSLEGTSTIENVIVTGDVKVEATFDANGASRVAVIAGGNSYGNVTMKNVHVNANDDSYLKANNNVGALAGQLQGKNVFENCSSNIDVTAKKFFAGGLIGIAADNSEFTNCHTTGDVTVTAGREGRANDHYRVGGIAGGWSDGKTNVCTLTNCTYTGNISGTNADGSVVTFFDYAGYVGRGYALTNCAGSKVIIDGVKYVQAYNTNFGVYEINGDVTLYKAEDLKAFANEVNGGNYHQGKNVVLAADIDLNNEEWTPIGTINKDPGFMGNFNGYTYKIKNLTISNPALDDNGYAYAGLFGITEGIDKDNQNVIKNLTIENVKISTTGHVVSAAIAYPYYTKVENVTVCGNIAITGGDYTAGALAYTRRCVDASDIKVEGNENSYITGVKVVGGVISDIQMDGGLTANYSNFNVSGVTITGINMVGGISGIISSQTLNGCSVKNVTLSCEDNNRIGIVSGSLGGVSKVSNVVYENVTGATAIIGATYDGGLAVEARIGDTYYATLEAAFTAATEGQTITLLNNSELSETIKVNNNITLDLNGKTITGTDKATVSFALFEVQPSKELIVNDETNEGKITLTATNNREWNAYSSVISNQRGKLTVNGGTIEHLGGTDMAYGIDNLTNGKGTYAETIINGGTVKSTYRAIRQFLNGVEAQNILTVNGGTIEGANKSIWMQDPSENANTGTLTIGEGATLNGDVYLFVTAGSTEWPVVVSIAEAALAEGSEITTGNVPAGYELKLENGVYGVKHGVAKISGVLYESLAEAATAAQDGETIELLWQDGQAPISMAATFVGNKTVTITGTANVDWSKGYLFVGRGGVGNATLTFDGADLTSASNSSSYGIHVSGRDKDTDNKYDGTLVIKNGSNIQLDYLIDRGTITIDNATLTVKNGFGIAGRPASETESGENATATISLINEAELIVNNHNGMGVGQAADVLEGYGIMSIDATSTFKTTQNFNISANGTMNNAGTVTINGTLTNNGTINFTDDAATLATTTKDLIINYNLNSDKKVVYVDGVYKVVEKVYVAQIGDDKFESLQEAVEAADNVTIVLIKTVEQADGVIIENKNITIDLNDYEFNVTEGSNTNNRNFKIIGASVVTIKNGTMYAKGDYSSGAYGTVRTEGTAVVTLDDLKLYNYRGNGLNIKACEGTTVNISNTEIYSEYGGGIEAAGGTINIAETVKVEQKGMYTAPYNSMAVSVNGDGTVTINGGTFSTECKTAEEASGQGSSHGPWVVGVLNSGGTLIINGGTFSNDNFGDNSLATNARGAVLGDTDANIQIKGGTFNALAKIIDVQNNLGNAELNPSFVLSGGIFSANPTNGNVSDCIVLAQGYALKELANGYYTVIQIAGTQTRDLATPGWYWFSTYIQFENEEVALDELQTALDRNASMIKGQHRFTNYSTYNGTGYWSSVASALTTLSTAEMYMIRTTAQTNVELTGDFVDYQNRDITLREGWNWIGYPVSQEMSLSDAIPAGALKDGDQIKSQFDGTATYYNRTLANGTPLVGWSGQLTQLKPGYGYMFNSASERTFNYTTDGDGAKSTLNTIDYNGENHWFADASRYPNNMTVTAMLSIDGEIVKDNYEVAAFANGECRGSVRPIYIEALDAYMLFMTIQGEDVENLTFKYYDVNYGTEYELSNTMVYSNDAIVGTLEEPYMFNLGILNIDESSVENISIYPNPTTTGKEINLQAMCDKVEVFNALGVKVAEYTNVDSIDAIETAGIYVIRVTIDGNARNCRLIVK